ncbi:hemin receptor [Dyadobacter sediminis]|nr:hemin receptor [Dyadobacter sediminis]
MRYSESNLTGSARFQALGGNHAALGGDPSVIHGNPAGLGFYNRSELTVSPAVTSINNNTRYIDDSRSSGKSNFNVAQASLVIASQPGFQRKWKGSSLGISFSRQQTFQDKYNFSGLNNRSAYLDQVVENVNADGTTVSQLETDFESDPAKGGPVAYSLPSAYYQMYLINPTSTTGPPYAPLNNNNSAADQFGTYSATGANTQWNIAYAGNYNDKFYIGATLGFSRLRYKYTRTFQDNYTDSPELVFTQQDENLTVTGNGINVALGVIYKFNPFVQIGGVLTSPTFTSIKETFNQNVSAQYVDNKVTGPDGDLITPPYTSLPIAPNDFVYSLTSPFRGNFGATFFFQDKGFITGSVEYVGYAGMGANTNYLSSTSNEAFKNETKAEIKDTYRNTANFRIGGEYRMNIFRARAGVAYLGDPYSRTDGLNRQKLLFSAGAGVRGSRFFADLTGTFLTYKTAFTPYTLASAQDYSSVEITNKPVNVMLTIGTTF